MKVAARDFECMARPTGVGRALATYEIPILGEPIEARSIQLRRDGGGPELDGP
jgi:hypothetical protein